MPLLWPLLALLSFLWVVSLVLGMAPPSTLLTGLLFVLPLMLLPLSSTVLRMLSRRLLPLLSLGVTTDDDAAEEASIDGALERRR